MLLAHVQCMCGVVATSRSNTSRQQHARTRVAAVPRHSRRDILSSLSLLGAWHTTSTAWAADPAEITVSSPSQAESVFPSAASSGASDSTAEGIATGGGAVPQSRAGPEGGIPVETKDFLVVMPAGFVDAQPPPAPTSGFGAPVRTTLGSAKVSPLKARYQTADGRESVSVIEKAAADIKPTFMQITDISQFGTLAEVAGLVLPRDVVMLSSVTTQLTLPPKDTGTVRGIVERAPQTIYRYEFTTRNQHVVLAAASKKGRIFVAAGSTDEETFLTAEGRLRAAVDSFMLIVE